MRWMLFLFNIVSGQRYCSLSFRETKGFVIVIQLILTDDTVADTEELG